jgi:hypothetical protein
VSGEDTARLLKRCADRGALADRLEAEAVRLAEVGAISNAADHFIVAEGLRGRARVIP